MSAIDFVTGGTEAESLEEINFEKSSIIEVQLDDQVHSSLQSAKALKEKAVRDRTAQKVNDNSAFSRVDNIVLVRTVSPKMRDLKVRRWEVLQSKMNQFFYGSLFPAALGLIFASQSGAKWVGVAGIVATLVGLLLSSRRYRQASEQVALWKQDLPALIAHQRTFGLDKGLIQMYREDDKRLHAHLVDYHRIFGPLELQGLYGEYIEEFAKRAEFLETNKDKLRFIREAAKESPLSKGIVEYAKLDEPQKSRLETFLEQHNKFIRIFDNVEERLKEEINTKNTESMKAIAQIQRKLDEVLDGVRGSFDKMKEAAERRRDKKIAELPELPKVDPKIYEKPPAYNPELEQEPIPYNPDLQQNVEKTTSNQIKVGPTPEEIEREKVLTKIRKECQEEIKEAKRIRDDLIAKLRVPFDQQIQTIKGENTKVIREMREHRDAQLIPLFPCIKTLHEGAQKAFASQGSYYQPAQQQDPAMYLPVYPSIQSYYKVPSAPTLEKIMEGEKERHDAQIFDQFLKIYHQEAIAK